MPLLPRCLPVLMLTVAAVAAPLTGQVRPGGTGRAISAAAAAAADTADGRSAAVRDVRYEVRFNRDDAASRRFHVTMSMAVAGDGPVILSMPAWTPGAYDLTYFARWVSNFAASSGGHGANWDKVDHDTWRVHHNRSYGDRLVVSFDLAADSLDTAMSWTRDDFGFFNGTNLFPYPEGRPLDFAARVKIVTESDWRVATGLTETAPREYEAPTYHDLVDMPTFVGRFDYDSARISNTWVRFATYPTGAVTGVVRQGIWHQFQRMIPPQVRVFGEVPWGPHYTVLQVSDTSSGGGSGLEHQNSHLDIVTPLAHGSIPIAGLYAHEIFHAWNVKRLRPQGLWPYRYDRMQPTSLLWVSEGITDYYADLALVRGGLIDARQFYETTAGKATNVALAPAVALEDASLTTWIAPGDGTAYLYYDKGSLVGLLLDILIRDRTDNRGSLDVVMRELYEKEYKRGSGFTEAEFWATVNRVAGGLRNAPASDYLRTFVPRFIDGREPLPYKDVLALAGLRVTEVRAPRLGITTEPDGDSVRITAVQPGSAAAVAGVRPGDVLLALGALTVTDQNFGAAYRARYAQAAEGTSLPIRVRRGGETFTLPGVIRYALTGITIAADPAASPRALRVRDGILLGRSQ